MWWSLCLAYFYFSLAVLLWTLSNQLFLLHMCWITNFTQTCSSIRPVSVFLVLDQHISRATFHHQNYRFKLTNILGIYVAYIALAFWQIMETTGQCVTINEPDSISRIAGKCQKFGATEEIRRLARDVVRMQCRPYNSPQTAYVIKVIGLCTATAMPLFG